MNIFKTNSSSDANSNGENTESSHGKPTSFDAPPSETRETSATSDDGPTDAATSGSDAPGTASRSAIDPMAESATRDDSEPVVGEDASASNVETTSKAVAEAEQGPGPAASSATTSATSNGSSETSAVSVVVSEHGASAASDVGVVAVGPNGAAAASEFGVVAVGPDGGSAASNAANATTVAVSDRSENRSAREEGDPEERVADADDADEGCSVDCSADCEAGCSIGEERPVDGRPDADTDDESTTDEE